MQKDNVAVFIDGFNYYHAICQHMDDVLYASNLKWLDYDKLLRTVILKNKTYDELKINFYTAVNTYKLDNKGNLHKSIKNHKIFTEALKRRHIKVVEGKFKLRDEKLNCYLQCSNCTNINFVHKFEISTDSQISCHCGHKIDLTSLRYFKKVEEKKTDVKIAIDIINTARDGKYNKLYLFSTDSDFVPVVEYIKDFCPNVKIYIVAPSDKITIRKATNGNIDTKAPYRYGVSEFENLGIKIIRLKLSKLRHCLLPNHFDGLTNPWL